MAVGRIGKPHGVRGWVTVAPSTDEPDLRFAEGAIVLIDDRPRSVVESRIGSRLMVLFDGCHTREDAEALRGRWVEVVIGDEPIDDPDEFYDHQLEGLRVRTVDGLAVGVVAEVLHTPGGELLSVRAESGAEILVPFVSAIVTSVSLAEDPEGGVVVIDPPEGLLDLGS